MQVTEARYPLRMADAQNPASALAKMRWGSQVVDRAVDTLAQRSHELTDAQRLRLRALAERSAVEEVSRGDA